MSSSDDIVDRLRQWFDYAPIANFGDLDDDIAEAADEIERLRAELDSVKANTMCHHMRHTALCRVCADNYGWGGP